MSDAKEKAVKGGKRAIVSSAHLVSERAAETSAFEYGLYIASNAFNRWITRCMAAAGYPDLGALDVMVLHTVNHRARDKKLADVCFVLNIEDSHTVNYALKKLTRLGLVAGDKRGKEIFYATTEEGQAACVKYREVREDCLITAVSAFGGDPTREGGAGQLNEQIGEAADLLRALSASTTRRQDRHRVFRGCLPGVSGCVSQPHVPARRRGDTT